MRLDQYISKTLGISRSDSKNILKKKEIKVNNNIITDLSYQVNDLDTVTYKDNILVYEEFVYYLLNKPIGYVTSTYDPKYKTVMELLDVKNKEELFPVGRLDIDTEGLLLITNDGKLSHDLLSPSKHIDKVYLVKSLKELSDEDILKVKNGIMMDNKITNPIDIKRIDSLTYEIKISDGRYHEVKRIFEYLYNKVVSLKRIKMGSLVLPSSLNTGSFIKLNKSDIESIRNV